ncbi:MAG: DUF3285 domain-containing protein [Cyanosarcina radialis HA8281-LM2]|nr:DUF3285 domain-containing protein [Cyanosarcina radialis HA8281-LM2]
MIDPSSSPPASESPNPTSVDTSEPASSERPAGYVKLAMRNMVKKRGTSLKHFALTVAGVLAALIGIAYLTR